MEGKIEWDASKKNPLDRMAVKLTDWAKNGQVPDIASSDVAYALELQKKRLEQKNLTTEMELLPHETFMQECGKWQDQKYSSIMNFHLCTRQQSYHKDGKRIHQMKEDCTLYTITTSANYADAVENDSYNCPSCGAVSTVKQLREECPYCKTKFMMSDLFPKVTNFYFLESFKLDNGKLRLLMLLCALVGAAFGLLKDGLGTDVNPLMVIGNMIGCAIGFVVLGYLLLAFSLLFYVVVKAAASIPQLIRGGGTAKKVEQRMKKYDALFSYKYFEGKVLSLLKMVLYSNDLGNLAAYEGAPLDLAYADIVDVTYAGSMGLKSFQVEVNEAHVELDVFLMNTYYKNNRISRKREVVTMSLCKNISKPSDFGFSIKAVCCPNCGGSFDATRQKKCPYCSGGYQMKEHDWVVTAIR